MFIELNGEVFRVLKELQGGGCYVISTASPTSITFIDMATFERAERVAAPESFSNVSKGDSSRYQLIQPLLEDEGCITDRGRLLEMVGRVAETEGTTKKRILRLFHNYLGTGRTTLGRAAKREQERKPIFDTAIRMFHYWNSIWTDKPMVHCLPHWTLPDKVEQTVRVEMYSNCHEVELVVNGESQGKRPHTQGQIASWEATYQPGAIQALGYNNGILAAQKEYKTAGQPVSVALDVVFEGTNEVLVKAKVVDENGEICPNAAIPVTFRVENGVVLGVGNGNPSCHEPDVSDSRSTFNGLALGIIRRAAAGIPITISAQSEELGTATINA